MGNPACHTGSGKERSEELLRDAEHTVGQAGIEVDVGGNGVSHTLHGDFPDCILEQLVESELVHAALFLCQIPAELAQDLCAGIAQSVDCVAEAVDQAAVVKIILVQDPVDDIPQLILIGSVIRVRNDLAHHSGDRNIGTAVLGTFQGADGCAQRGVQIRTRGTDNDVCESRVVTAAVIRMDQKDRIEQICLMIGKLSVRAKHIEDILRHGIIAAGIVDDQRAAVKGMYLGVVGITSQRRELRDQVDSLEQILVDICLIRRFIIVVERKNCGLKLIHQVPGRLEQELIGEETFRQLIAQGQRSLEILKILPVGQISEQEQETSLLKAVVLLTVFDQVLDGITAVEQIALTGDYFAVLIRLITDDIRDSCQTDPDTCTVLVSKTFFYIIFTEKVIRDVGKHRRTTIITSQNTVIVEVIRFKSGHDSSFQQNTSYPCIQ